MPYQLEISLPENGRASCGCEFVKEDPYHSYGSYLVQTRYHVKLCAIHSKEKYSADLADLRTNINSLMHQLKVANEDLQNLKNKGENDYQGYCIYYP